MSTGTAIFFMLVKECSDNAAAGVTAQTPLADIIGLMATNKLSAVCVIDAEGRPSGIITEQDIVRRVAFNADARQPASDIMSAPVHTIGEDEALFIAIVRMRRLGHRHLPVVDGDGRLCGILDFHKTMVRAAGEQIDLIDRLTRDDSLDGLREIKAAQADVAARLFADSIQASEIRTLLTHINNYIHRSLLRRNLAILAERGRGDPPVPFSMIIMGSGGRGENYLYPDQDYGFILADYDDHRHNDIDPWFIDLAEGLSDDLNAVGLPYCSGNVMATNPLWRKTISQWKAQIDYWNQRSLSATLLNFDIFFDFQGCWGDPALAAELRRHVTQVTKNNEPFLRAVHASDRDHGTALGWFGRFATEQKDPEYKGQVNIKLYGSLPLVEGIRMLAMREGVSATSTLARLAALHQLGAVNDDDHEYLKGASETLCNLLLNRQIADFKAGRKVSNFINPRRLSQRQRSRLREAFRAIDGLRKRINFEVGGEIF